MQLRLKLRFIGLTIILTCSLLGTLGLGQQLPFDPGLRWQVLETPHFRIIYHTGLAGPAREATQVAEEAYKFWTTELAYAPPDKTNIVLADVTDFGDGYTVPFLNDDIVIYTSSWDVGRWANARFSGWLERVITHEYGHIADTTSVQGFAQYIRAVFGSAFLPNFFKPMTWLEGIADYGEFLKSGHSRADDPRTEMMLRVMAQSGHWPTLAQLTTDYDRQEWPSPNGIAHDLGPWLMRYLEERYGRGTIARLDAAQSENLPSLLSLGLLSDFGGALRSVTGESPEAIYKGFQDWAMARVDAAQQAVKAAGSETSSRTLTHLGYSTDAPAWSPDGQQLAHWHSDPARLGGLWLVSAAGEGDHALIPGPIEAAAWLPSQPHPTLIYPKLEIYKGHYLFEDLYRYDLVTQQEERLTFGERAYAVAPFPDGRRLAIARDDDRYRPEENGPGSSLIVYDLKTHTRQILLEFGGQATIESLSVSPDGSQLALSIWRRGGYQDIYLLTSDGQALWPATSDQATDLDPHWSVDGQYVLFSSARSGIYNLYAYRVSDAQLFQVTNTLSGAFDPAVSPDGRTIAFVGYSAAGYNIRTMPYDPQSWKPVAHQYDTIPRWPGYPSVQSPSRPYDPIPSLRPKLWLPWIEPGRVGLFTLGQDALAQQSYTLRAGYQWVRGLPFFELTYTNSQLGGQLALEAGGDLLSSHESVSLNLPLERELTRQQALQLGYRRSDEPERASQQFFGSWAYEAQKGLDLSREAVRISLSGQWGWTNHGSVQSPARQIVLDWQEHIRLPFVAENDLITELRTGWSDTARAFQLGGDKGTYPLRGFPPEAFSGKQLLLGKLEYQFPLLAVERGLGLWPLFLDKVRGVLFAEAGTAADQIDLTRLGVSFGSEIHFQLVLERFVPATLQLGIAQGLGQPGPRLYLHLDSAF